MEHRPGVIGLLLWFSFMKAWKVWDGERERETLVLFAELGLDPEEIRKAGRQGADKLMEQAMSRPGAEAIVERLFNQFPELKLYNEAKLQIAEKAAVEFLSMEEALVFRLEDEEVQPWSDKLAERFKKEAPEFRAWVEQGSRTSKKALKKGALVFYEVADEMTVEVFTPARKASLHRQLTDYHATLADEDDRSLAFQGLLAATAPGTSVPGNRVLVELCSNALSRNLCDG